MKMEDRDRDLDPAVKQSDRSTAVIDIGSNSVRLVVFDGPKRAPLPKFNEKVLCGLGQDLGTTGRLGQAAMEDAITALRRYSALVNQMGIERVMVAATAAVREAQNGSEFVSEIEQECDLNVQVLSGKQEARYAGLGVLSGIPHANGVVGDLGGGSLELVDLSDSRIAETATLPLGSLRLTNMHMSEKRLRKEITKKIAGVDWLEPIPTKNFYVVGGGWRSLAKYHIAKTGYPLNIVHNYRLSLPDIVDFLDEVIAMDDDIMMSTPGIAKSRASTLKTSAIIMQIVLDNIRPKDVIFSGNGLREGMLFSELKKSVRKRDPLMEACRDMAAREGRFAEHGEEIYEWIQDLVEHADVKGNYLALAAATLSDIAWWVSPDYRAAQAFRRIFRAPFNGIGHRGRAIVALAVYARYRGNFSGNAPDNSLTLLSESEAKDALTLGLALRLSHTLSGGIMGILKRTKLRVLPTEIILEVPEDLSNLLGVHVSGRLKILADAIGKTSKICIVTGE